MIEICELYSLSEMVKEKNSPMKNYVQFFSFLKKFKIMSILMFINIIGLFILSLLRLLKPIKIIKLYHLRYDRIGHLAINTDLFLRRIKLGKIKTEGIIYIGLATTKPVNKQLFKMFKRKMNVVELPDDKTYGFVFRFITILFDEKSVYQNLYKSLFPQEFTFYSISRSKFYQEMPMNSNEYYELNNAEKNLFFTQSEEKRGGELLKDMGMGPDDWFVCFHSRDSTYMLWLDKSIDKSKGIKQDYRDCNIDNFIKATEYISLCGGHAIRMGFHVEKKLPDLKNEKIIDYANKYQSDFGDIYLLAKCKFFISNTSGLWLIPTIFHTPVAGTNFIPIHTPMRKGDIFIPKKLWSKKNKRYLALKEQLDFENKGKNAFEKIGKRYEKAGMEVVENSADEILELTKEMNECLDGIFKITEKDKKLQKKFRSIIKKNHVCYDTPARIGAKFLRDNQDLLD